MDTKQKTKRGARRDLYWQIWGLFWEAELTPHQISEEYNFWLPDIFKAIEWGIKKYNLSRDMRIVRYKRAYYGLPKNEEFWWQYTHGFKGRKPNKVIHKGRVVKKKKVVKYTRGKNS